MLGRWIESDLLPSTQRLGSGVIAFCPLASGLLTDRYLNGVPADSRHARDKDGGQGWWKAEQEKGLWDKLGKLNAIAQERGQTLAQMALAWTVRLPAVTSALIGVSNVEQLKDNLGAIENLSFTDEELKRIEAIL
jgi:L-glyceraldehyde 3-phosphate reductase